MPQLALACLVLTSFHLGKSLTSPHPWHQTPGDFNYIYFSNKWKMIKYLIYWSQNVLRSALLKEKGMLMCSKETVEF